MGGALFDPAERPLQIFCRSEADRKDSFPDLKPLELVLGAGVEDVGGVRVGRSELGRLQPVFEAREVVQELAPETPGLLDPTSRISPSL